MRFLLSDDVQALFFTQIQEYTTWAILLAVSIYGARSRRYPWDRSYS